MIYIKPHIKSWAKNCKDIKELLSQARQAINADNPLMAKSPLEQAEKIKGPNDILFARICQVLQKATETKPNTLACPRCGHHTFFGKGFVVEGNEVTQHMACTICKTRWVNRYTYVDSVLAADQEHGDG